MEAQLWNDQDTKEWFVAYFDNRRADGWIGLHHEPTEAECRTIKAIPGRCTAGSPQWWAKPAPSCKWVTSYNW